MTTNHKTFQAPDFEQWFNTLTPSEQQAFITQEYILNTKRELIETRTKLRPKSTQGGQA